MNRDETDCKQSEDATWVSEERYHSLFENNPHPMWVYDLETLVFLEVNDAAIAHYGQSREEFLAMTIKEEWDVAACHDLGVNSYIRKPVDFTQFAQAIGHLGLYWLLLNEPPPKVRL